MLHAPGHTSGTPYLYLFDVKDGRSSSIRPSPLSTRVFIVIIPTVTLCDLIFTFVFRYPYTPPLLIKVGSCSPLERTVFFPIYTVWQNKIVELSFYLR